MTCVENKGNKYRFSFDEQIGNYVNGFVAVYNEKDNTFVFDDSIIVGTLIKK